PIAFRAIGFFRGLCAHSLVVLWGDFCSAKIYTGTALRARKKGARSLRKQCATSMCYWPASAGVPASPEGSHATLLHRVELSSFSEPGEGSPIGSRHPGLPAECHEFGEERGPSRRVEMGGDLVEEQDRRDALAMLGHQIAVGQDEADEQGLLLSSGA